MTDIVKIHGKDRKVQGLGVRLLARMRLEKVHRSWRMCEEWLRT